ncbi:MAG: carboxypeptidase regulatory-like domain-containing protein [Bacteroidota bacterium]
MKLVYLLSLCLGLMSLSFAPSTKTILSGAVTDAGTREPLIGVTIKVLKTTKSAQTDINGKYSIELEAGVYDVECTYTGYASKRIVEVSIEKDKENNLDFALEAARALTETVVTGHRDRSTIPGEFDRAPAMSKTIDVTSAGTSSIRAKSGEPIATKGAPEKISAKPAAAPAKDVRIARDAAPIKAGKVKSSPPGSYSDGIRATDDVAKREAPRAEDKSFDFDMPTYSETPIRKDAEEAMSPTPGPSVPSTPSPHAGLLTAGEWNDLHNWNHHWVNMQNDGELDPYQKMYGFTPKYRYTVMLSNEQDFPVVDAPVKLRTAGGELLWEARTDNTGKAELWAGMFDDKEPLGLRVEALLNGRTEDLGSPKAAKDGINRHQIAVECKSPKNVDIVWAVDATGSMGDEIEYLKTELLDVIGRAKSRNPALAFRMGTVFYRDKGDDYITKSSGLSENISETVEFIRKQYAGGGGDYPEAVHSALEEAIFNQKWSKDAVTRICFLVLDASPHQDPAVNASLQRSIREAARLGIRIVPVTASGIQKDTEFLMKFFGLATNGSYVFLTDHSGIGGKHLEPTTEEYKVELLNDLLVRLITEYTAVKTCEGQSAIRFDDPQAQQQQLQTLEARYYPNPANQQFILDLPFDVQSVTIFDSEGKLARKLENLKAGQTTIQVNELPEGFYTIRILKDNQVQTGKLMVVRT